jgi:hypothetical protein
MRPYILLLHLFFSLIFCAAAQADFTKAYYPFIYRAELAILKEDYSSALRSYDSAFKAVTKPFARDYFNATICASKVVDYQTAYRYCDSLIAKGVTRDFFTSYGSLRPLWETPQWPAFLESYGQKYKQYNSHRDTSLKQLFIRLDMQDQEFRRKAGSYRLFGDTIRKIDSNNVRQLIALMHTVGFPNEQMTGKGNPTSFFFPGYLILLHHAERLAKTKKSWYNPLQDYITAVKKGELDPHLFVQLLAIQNDTSLSLGSWGVSVCEVNRVRSKLMVEKYTPEQKALINQARLLYGLEPLEEYYQKALFVLRNDRSKEFAFRPYEHLIIYFMEEETKCDEKKQGYVEIE